jgi:hypothetical protein
MKFFLFNGYMVTSHQLAEPIFMDRAASNARHIADQQRGGLPRLYRAECHALREAITALRTQPRLQRLVAAIRRSPPIGSDQSRKAPGEFASDA